MKTFLLTFSIIAYLTNFAAGQTMETTINKLLQLDLITTQQKPDIEDALKRSNEITSSSIFFALQYAEMIKIFGRKSIGLGVSIGFENEKLSPGDQDKINAELQNYLNKLNAADLLTPQLYQSFKAEIDSGNFFHKLQLLSQLSSQSAYIEWISPANLIPFSNKLFENKIVTDSYKQLQSDITDGKIESNYQLIGYCQNAKFFDLAKYSNDPSLYLEEIHKDVSQIFPELSFTDFNFKVEADSAESFSDFTSYKVVVSIKCNGKIFKQKSFISPNDIGKDNNYFGKIDEQVFYQIFNKVLSDLQSPYRLHHIKTDYRYFGIVALRKEQTEMFRNMNSLIDISYENFKSKLTSKRIDEAIAAWKKIGLFNHLTPEQIKQATERMVQDDNRNLNDVLSHFPDVISSFDLELENLENPYTELTKEFSEISHGVFNPANISDNFSKPANNKVTFKFDLNGKTYSKDLLYENDWADPEFITLIQQAVTENKLNGQFYDLDEGGQGANLIFLTQQQYDYLKQNKLLVFGDDWQDEEE